MISHSLKLNGRSKLKAMIITGITMKAGKKISAATAAKKELSKMELIGDSFLMSENDLSKTRRTIKLTKWIG